MSNFTGGNPANGTNLPHRNAMYRTPSAFYNAVLPSGALSFLLCAGNMRGAVHDGKTCGGAAHFPLFSAGTNFDPLYALLDAAEDGDDGNSGVVVPPEPVVEPRVEEAPAVTTTTTTTATQKNAQAAPSTGSAVANMFSRTP